MKIFAQKLINVEAAQCLYPSLDDKDKELWHYGTRALWYYGIKEESKKNQRNIPKLEKSAKSAELPTSLMLFLPPKVFYRIGPP